MTTILRSFVSGRWVEGTGERNVLVNPATEAVAAETSTRGVDFKDALQFARGKGGPVLRSLTFAQRGELLAKLASAIHDIREELVELAIANGGNTRGDAKFDIDGAAITLQAYADLGKQLGGRKFLLDGEQIALGRNPRLIGQHVWLPLTGVAVHINAFNFPAWGMGEKAAACLLAGMPFITKPATATALTAWRIAEEWVKREILPPGVFSFIAGSPGDLLDHLTSQDVLSFTGSGLTAHGFRTRESIVKNSVRLNVEADSLNSAVMGLDVEPGSATWEFFLNEVSRDITQKAGQKCTAIRRIFVPRHLINQAKDELAARLSEVKVGNPALKEVKMGPVATAQQLRDVRAGVQKLRAQAEAVLNDGGRGQLIAVDGERGYFVAPTLLLAGDPWKAADVHSHEVFGPVSTLMPYNDVEDAIGLVRLGDGSLVASVYSDDKDFVQAMVFGVAPYSGRIHVGGEKIAEHSPGPGTVLAQQVHGGPGRAGGGEELGGLRGLEFYSQRTAVQGLKPLLEKVFG